MKHHLFLLIMITLISSSTAQKKVASQDKNISAFDQYVQTAMRDWSVPGMGVVVVKDNRVLFSKTYGVREFGRPDQVNNHTLFSIGSTTKAMTAVCMGILVDQGKVKWEDEVIRHLPDLQLYDPYITRNLRIKDLFTHNSGTGNTDFLWGNMTITPEEIIKKMAQVKPVYPFRGGFVYQNIFYLIAGQVIERVSGKPWEVFIRERIFIPLQMEHTVPLLGMASAENIAIPHYLFDGVTTPIKRASADSVGPAGSVYSCIEDLAKWAQCMIDGSKYPGGRLLQHQTWQEMFRPQVIVPANQFYPTAQILQPSWTTYGLGWFQHDYKGRKINYHTGSLPGEIAMHAQLPSENMAFYFVGNMDHAELRHALVYKSFDLFALGGERDWNKEFLTLYGKIEFAQKFAISSQFASRNKDTEPSQPLKNFAGKYSNALQGNLVISESNGILSAGLNNTVRGTLEHFHFDTFKIRYSERWMGEGLITFHRDATGKITQAESGGERFILVAEEKK